MDGGQFVREARLRAGLTQRRLAALGSTTPAVVSRIESGKTSPSYRLVMRLVRACGFDLVTHVVPLDEDAWTLAEQGELLSPDERLDRMLAGLELFDTGRRARERDA